jgi:replicative superfamily II helicase
MVDFKKLRSSKAKASVTDPIEIFRRLPKPPGITDLYISEAHVLEEWYQRREERDLVIKLHTGGGKTLVGLLIAQSILNEIHEPVVYLSPTTQLVEQCLERARDYGIPAMPYAKNEDFPDEFLSGNCVLICTYQALFNGMSRFGAPGSKRDPLHAGGIILDDAHVSFSTVRDSFTLRIEKDSDKEAYEYLTNLFRHDFELTGRLGTFDDVVSGLDYNILEVPYWNWFNKDSQVREYLRKNSDNYLFEWPFLRDSFEYCHALISKNSFVITPVFPLVDLVPTFSICSRRVFMSATIGDDSAIVRTFNAGHESIAKPISSSSLAGTSERMILAPELMKLNTDIPSMLHKVAEWAAGKRRISTVVLVPSGNAAKTWIDVCKYADSAEMVVDFVRSLQEGKSKGPFVFANRYDGIDLPGNSCRLLIVSGLPRGTSEYDQFRSNVFLHGKAINSALAQRVEQGMGRAARGPGDYCVVIITGKDLIAWIGRSANVKFLTSSSRAQLEMGIEVSKNVKDSKSFAETMESCFKRDKEWIEYHAETLAESVVPEEIDVESLRVADAEQKAFQLWRDGYCEKAIAKLEKYLGENPDLDNQSKGWVLQFAARIAYHWSNKEMSQGFQQNAYGHNRYLLKPEVVPPYVPLPRPSKQAAAIVEEIFRFTPRRGFLSEFDEVVSHLVPEATSNQFEASLESLGKMLGFSSERPERIYGVGPDVLWLVSDKLGLVIEAKSRKDGKNALTKDQHGQLLVAVEWFKKEYPDYSYLGVSVHPNKTATKNAIAEDTKALTYDTLSSLISNARGLFTELCEMARGKNEIIASCEHLLSKWRLHPVDLIREYLLLFELETRYN